MLTNDRCQVKDMIQGQKVLPEVLNSELWHSLSQLTVLRPPLHIRGSGHSRDGLQLVRQTSWV